MALCEAGDARGIKVLMHEDARFSMPPAPEVYYGSETIVNSWAEGGFGTEEFGHCRCVATRTNRQPATANYLRPPGADEYTLAAVDVLRIEDGLITDVTAFYGPALNAFDLPRTLPV